MSLIIHHLCKSLSEILNAILFSQSLGIGTEVWNLYINKIKGILVFPFKTFIILWSFPSDQDFFIATMKGKNSNWFLYLLNKKAFVLSGNSAEKHGRNKFAIHGRKKRASHWEALYLSWEILWLRIGKLEQDYWRSNTVITLY